MLLKQNFTLLNSHLVSQWNSPLSQYLRYCRRLLRDVQTDITAGRLPRASCIHGRHDALTSSSRLWSCIQSLDRDYILELQSPFEGVESISGGMWSTSQDDALLKLHFQPGTIDLPIHSHDFSDRVITVLSGSGWFNVVALDGHGEQSLRSKEMLPGDVLVFTRGVKHTFRTEREHLRLLSYHAPFIGLDDPRQFTIDHKLAAT